LPATRAWLIRALFILSTLGGVGHAYGNEPLTIYFYNPEINITRNALLKNTFDLYLEALGDYQFQPVDDKATFEALIKNEANAIFMMSNWHYLQVKNTQTNSLFNLALRGIKGGSDSFHKILVGKDPQFDLNAMSLATSGNREYSLAILNNIALTSSVKKLSKNLFSNLNLLTVPKDIDALMAVGFDLADAALTTKSSLVKLSTIYKNQRQALHILGESQALKRLAVAFKQSTSPKVRALLSEIIQMENNKQGRRGLNMLGLDSWQLVNESIMQTKMQKRRPLQ